MGHADSSHDCVHYDCFPMHVGRPRHHARDTSFLFGMGGSGPSKDSSSQIKPKPQKTKTPPDPRDEHLALVGPEALSSQMAVDTAVRGQNRPSGTRDDSFEFYFDMFMLTVGVGTIAGGFGWNHY